MYCKHCGKEIADDSKFCQHCGGIIEADKENAKEPISQKEVIIPNAYEKSDLSKNESSEASNDDKSSKSKIGTILAVTFMTAFIGIFVIGGIFLILIPMMIFLPRWLFGIIVSAIAGISTYYLVRFFKNRNNP